jgi:hypothetical protein
MLRLVDPIYRKLGFSSRTDDTHLDILLRKKAVSVAHSPATAYLPCGKCTFYPT